MSGQYQPVLSGSLISIKKNCRSKCRVPMGRDDMIRPMKKKDMIILLLTYVGPKTETCRHFRRLIYNKKIDVSYLTTHTFKLEDAPAAYDMIMTKSESFIGILIEYDVTKELERGKVIIKPPTSLRAGGSYEPEANLQPSSVSIGFIGAGSYAQSHLLPNIPKSKDVLLNGVMTTTGTSSRSVAERYGFDFCTTNEKDIIENDDINTVFIATRHDSHAHYVMKALKAGKHVFTEKPLCLKEEELSQIVELLNSQIGEHESDFSLQTFTHGWL